MIGWAVGLTFLCSGVLALFILAIIEPDWLTYEYRPADSYDPPYLPKPPSTSAGSLKATMSLWEGCFDATFYSSTSWSPSDIYKSRQYPRRCFDVITYNDRYFKVERRRFSLSTNNTKTTGVTQPTTTPTPNTPPPNHYVTGYVRTVSPPTTQQPQPAPYTLAAINCPLPPDMVGATFKIDTPYTYGNVSFSRATYSCDNGDYALINARDYTLQSYCVNGSWTPTSTCTPQDKCLPENGDWDVCIAGRAWDPDSIVKVVGGQLPIQTAKISGFGIALFPEFEFQCDGLIRQWDIYSNVSGTAHLSVWTRLGKRYYMIAKNTVNSDGSGLQGFVIEPGSRIFVRKGYFIGIGYNNLINFENETTVPIYRAVALDQANPMLDWTQLQFSEKAIMINVSQSDVDSIGWVDLRSSNILFQKIEGENPVIPIVAAYVTGAITRPIRYKTVQALMILAALAEFVSVVCVIFFGIVWTKRSENMLSGSLQAAIFLNLFSCVSAINGVCLLIQEYDCNTISPTLGTAIFIAFGGIALAAVSVIVLCVADRRLMIEMGRKQLTIVVKPPSAMA